MNMIIDWLGAEVNWYGYKSFLKNVAEYWFEYFHDPKTSLPTSFYSEILMQELQEICAQTYRLEIKTIKEAT